MSTRLEQDREEIDQIDAQIAELFEKRFHVVHDIIDFKIENRMPILDSGREKDITERSCARIEDDQIRIYFRSLYTHMLDLSREYQKEVLDGK